jgi:hypothetical protein
MDLQLVQTKTFQGKKLTFTPLNYNTWRPLMMSQQLGSAIPTGEWPTSVSSPKRGQSDAAAIPSTDTQSTSEGKEPEPRRTTSGSGDEGKPPATQEPLQLRPQVPNNDAPSEAELKYSEERFTADLGKLHSAWQFILSGISPQSIDIVKINDSYEKATKE